MTSLIMGTCDRKLQVRAFERTPIHVHSSLGSAYKLPDVINLLSGPFWLDFTVKARYGPHDEFSHEKQEIRLRAQISEFLSYDIESKCKIDLHGLNFPKIFFVLPPEYSGAVEYSTKLPSAQQAPEDLTMQKFLECCRQKFLTTSITRFLDSPIKTAYMTTNSGPQDPAEKKKPPGDCTLICWEILVLPRIAS